MLSNRELAIAIYGIVVLVACILYKNTRVVLGALVKTAFSWKIMLIVLLTLGYIAAGVWILHSLELWGCEHIKETILWAIFSGLAIGAGGITEAKPNQLFLGIIKSQMCVAVVIGFLVNFYSLPFLGELLLFPALVLFGMMGAVSEGDKKLAQAKGCIQTMQALVGVGLLFYVGYRIYQQPDEFFTVSLINSFAIPIFLALWTVPVGYVFSIVAAYESAFIRMRLEGDLRSYAKKKFRKTCGLNANRIKRANTLLSGWLFSAENLSEIDSLFRELEKTLEDPAMDESGDFVWEEKYESMGNDEKFVSMDEYLVRVMPLITQIMKFEGDLRELLEESNQEGGSLEFLVTGVKKKEDQLENFKGVFYDLPQRQGRMRKIHRPLEAYVSAVETLYLFVVNDMLEEADEKRMDWVLNYDLEECVVKRKVMLDALDTWGGNHLEHDQMPDE